MKELKKGDLVQVVSEESACYGIVAMVTNAGKCPGHRDCVVSMEIVGHSRESHAYAKSRYDIGEGIHLFRHKLALLSEDYPQLSREVQDVHVT